MTVRAVDNSAGNGFNEYLSVTSSDFDFSNTDSFIIGGWMNVTGQNAADAMLFDNIAGVSTIFSLFHRLGVNEYDLVISRHTVTETARSPLVSGRVFVLFWNDANTLTTNIQIDATSVVTQAYTNSPPTFTQTSTSFHFYRSGDATPSYGTNAVLDNWFYCKNPASVSSAISLIQSTVYNGGDGIQYDQLSAGDKTTLGLVSWWGMDELGLATRIDSHGTNDLAVSGTLITDTTPLVTQAMLLLNCNETLNTSDGRNYLFSQHALLQTISLADSIVGQLTNIKLLNETIFISDSFFFSPILQSLVETLKLSVWLQVKLNPPVSHWNN